MKMLERSVILMYDRSNSPTDIDLVNLDLLEKAMVIECHPASTGFTCRTQKACLISSGVHLLATYCTKHIHRESCRLRWNKFDGNSKITNSGDMISRKQKMQQKIENCSQVFIHTVH